MALIPGEHPTETGAKSAVKIGRRELAIRIRGVRAFVAGGNTWWTRVESTKPKKRVSRRDRRLRRATLEPLDSTSSLRKNTISNTTKHNYDRRFPFFDPWRRDPPPDEAATPGTGTKSKALSGTEYA